MMKHCKCNVWNSLAKLFLCDGKIMFIYEPKVGQFGGGNTVKSEKRKRKKNKERRHCHILELPRYNPK